jgi:hypothetical protein
LQRRASFTLFCGNPAALHWPEAPKELLKRTTCQGRKMQQQRFLGFLSFVLAVASASPALSQSDEAATTAQRLMVSSGLAVQLRGFTAQMEQQISGQTKLDQATADALASAAKEAFRADLLQADITARLTRKLTVGDMKNALVWLESRPGRAITTAEELSSTAFDGQRFASHLENLKKSPLSPKRVELIREMMIVTNAVAAAVATQEAVGLGVAIGINSLQPREQRVSESELRRRLHQLMPPDKVRGALEEQLPLLYSYVYREIRDADLEQYLAFLKGPHGKRYQDGMTSAYIEGLTKASVKVGELTAQRKQAI